MGLIEQLNKGLSLSEQQSISADQMIKRLGNQLLSAFAEKLKIKVNISKGKGLSFEQWNLDYLPKLFTAEAGYKPEDKELLRLIMKLSFQEDNFLSALFGQKAGEYTSEEQEYLTDIRKYNEKLAQEFIDNGLDLDQWLHYQSKEVFLIGPSADQLRRKKELFMKNLLENIEQLLGSHQRKQIGILTPSQAKQVYNQIIKKYHLQIGGTEGLSTEKGAIAIKDLANVLKEFNQLIKQIQQVEADKAKKAQIGTILDHLQELVKQIPNLDQELAQQSYQLSIQPWQRQPGYDLFQGNYTHCCVAVENFNRGAMLDYLIDAGLQVVEIKDETLNKTIAQTWLWLAKDKQGELNLILDNVEINGDYMGISDDIRKKLFAYLKKYSQAFGKGKIKRILLGTSYNDVKDDDLKTVNLIISKLAGAPRGEEYL
ncbi:MAG: hypothetical protein KAS12_04090, partial [Candidatus Aenigmarchaeota archaeon]|nr:hypothetical protein [Candidatus Aenigmarchaeota archaeon]